MDQDGANVQYLSSGKSLTFGPKMGPTGDTIAFTSYEDGNPQVYCGRARRQLQEADPERADVVCAELLARWRHGGLLGIERRHHQHLFGDAGTAIRRS